MKVTDCFTDMPSEYIHSAVVIGDTLSLWCNVSAAGVMWTRDDTGDGYVQYVYWNEQFDGSKRQLSVNITENDFHSLTISDVQFNDTGLYDCYDNSGLRTVGYHVTVHGMSYSVCNCVSMSETYYSQS